MVQTSKDPDSKISKLQAIINAVDYYNIKMEELAHQQASDPDFRQLLRDAPTGLQFGHEEFSLIANWCECS